jgi:hypothetical protein
MIKVSIGLGYKYSDLHLGLHGSDEFPLVASTAQYFLDQGKSIDYIKTTFGVDIILSSSLMSHSTLSQVFVSIITGKHKTLITSKAYLFVSPMVMLSVVYEVSPSYKPDANPYFVVGAFRKAKQWTLLIVSKINNCRWKNSLLHSMDSPAVEFSNDRLFALEGEKVFFCPSKMNLSQFIIHTNDRRSLILKYVEMGELLSRSKELIGSRLIHNIGSDQLWHFETRNFRIRFLSVRCGTGRPVFLVVPDTVSTVEEAQAWIQQNPQWIKPEVRT